MMRLNYSSWLIAVAVTMLAGSLSQAAIFYVDPQTGSMTNDGSAERPWATIEQVFANKLIQTHDTTGRLMNPNAPVKGGDTILLRSGYHGEIYCRRAYNDDYITIAAEEGQTPQVRRIFFCAVSKWVIRGLTVSPSFAAEYKPDRLIQMVDWDGPSSDLVIENNTLLSSPDAPSWTAEQWDSLSCYGIVIIAKRVKIRNNTLRYVNFGMMLMGDTITVEHNSIEHIAGDGIVCCADNTSLIGNTLKYFYRVNGNHDDAIQFHRGPDTTTPIFNAVVSGNIIIAKDSAVDNPLIGSPQGICNFDIPAINWRIENNIVLVQHHHGISIYGCLGGVIVNNLAYNPYGGDFQSGIMLGTTPSKALSEQTVIRNNLVDSQIFLAGPTNTADHNIIVTQPVRYFRDLKNYDMRLKEGCPAIDAGNPELAPEVDVLGVPRPQGAGVDIGPYEFKDAPVPANE